MAEAAADRASAIQTVTQSVQGLDKTAQLAAINAVVPPPDAATTKTLWIIVVSGLIGLIAIALGGLIFLLADNKTSDLALTAFTALLTGLIGLFAPSPVKTAASSTGE